MVTIDNKKILSAKEAREAIDSLITASERMIDVEAVAIADKFGIEISVGDYGSGRTYYPVGTDSTELNYSNYYGGFDENNKSTEGYWMSSSETC